MGRKPIIKPRARALARKQLSLQRLAEGVSIAKIAAELQVTPQRVRQYLYAALESESIYPTVLTAERVNELRALEAERLNKVWASGIETLETIKGRVGSDGEKSLDGSSVARLLDGLTRTSERICRLLGLDIPLRTVQEVFSLQVKRIDQRVTVSFDENQIKPAWSVDTGLQRVPSDEYEPTASHGCTPELLNGAEGAQAGPSTRFEGEVNESVDQGGQIDPGAFLENDM